MNLRPPEEDLRERTRQQVIDSLGGWSGTVVAAVPPLVFVAVNAMTGLQWAIIAALLSGGLVTVYRLVRRQPIQQAFMGLFSVAIAAAIAARSHEARGFFVLGIAAAILYAVVFAVSLLIRRPLVGVLWEFLDPTPLPEGQTWHKTRRLRQAYSWATAAALGMFTARAVVQLSLFQDNRTGLLAITKLAMGYPLYIAVIAFTFWIVRRARRSIGPVPIPQPADELGDNVAAGSGEQSRDALTAPEQGSGKAGPSPV